MVTHQVGHALLLAVLEHRVVCQQAHGHVQLSQQHQALHSAPIGCIGVNTGVLQQLLNLGMQLAEAWGVCIEQGAVLKHPPSKCLHTRSSRQVTSAVRVARAAWHTAESLFGPTRPSQCFKSLKHKRISCEACDCAGLTSGKDPLSISS